MELPKTLVIDLPSEKKRKAVRIGVNVESLPGLFPEKNIVLYPHYGLFTFGGALYVYWPLGPTEAMVIEVDQVVRQSMMATVVAKSGPDVDGADMILNLYPNQGAEASALAAAVRNKVGDMAMPFTRFGAADTVEMADQEATTSDGFGKSNATRAKGRSLDAAVKAKEYQALSGRIKSAIHTSVMAMCGISGVDLNCYENNIVTMQMALAAEDTRRIEYLKKEGKDADTIQAKVYSKEGGKARARAVKLKKSEIRSRMREVYKAMKDPSWGEIEFLMIQADWSMLLSNVDQVFFMRMAPYTRLGISPKAIHLTSGGAMPRRYQGLTPGRIGVAAMAKRILQGNRDVMDGKMDGPKAFSRKRGRGNKGKAEEHPLVKPMKQFERKMPVGPLKGLVRMAEEMIGEPEASEIIQFCVHSCAGIGQLCSRGAELFPAQFPDQLTQFSKVGIEAYTMANANTEMWCIVRGARPGKKGELKAENGRDKEMCYLMASHGAHLSDIGLFSQLVGQKINPRSQMSVQGPKITDGEIGSLLDVYHKSIYFKKWAPFTRSTGVLRGAAAGRRSGMANTDNTLAVERQSHADWAGIRELVELADKTEGNMPELMNATRKIMRELERENKVMNLGKGIYDISDAVKANPMKASTTTSSEAFFYGFEAEEDSMMT